MEASWKPLVWEGFRTGNLDKIGVFALICSTSEASEVYFFAVGGKILSLQGQPQKNGDPGDPPLDRVTGKGPHSETPMNTTLEDKNAVHGDPGDPTF